MFYPKYVAGELGFAHFKLIMCYCSSIWNIPTGLPHLSFSLYCSMCLCPFSSSRPPLLTPAFPFSVFNSVVFVSFACNKLNHRL